MPDEGRVLQSIQKALAQRYPSRRYAVMPEVGNGTGANVRRHVDLVTMGLWPSQGLLLEAIEVKTSRNDWLRELRQPLKQEQSIFRWVDRWWVAAPEGVVREDEVPPAWGLLELTARGVMRAAKEAPALQPEPMTRDFLAALLRRAPEEGDASAIAEMRRALRAEGEELANTRLKAEAERLSAELDAAEAAAQEANGEAERLRAELAFLQGAARSKPREGQPLLRLAEVAAWAAEATARAEGVPNKGASWKPNLAAARIEGAGLQLHGPGGAAQLFLAASAPQLAQQVQALADSYARVCALALSMKVDLGKA